MIKGMNMKNNEFLTVNEFAEVIGVHPNSVRNMIKKGRLSAFRVGGGERSSYRIARSEINRLSVIELNKIVDNLIDERSKK